MNGKRKAMFEARARIIKALAHPTRLAIVDELKNGPRCVCEIHAVTGADRTTVSKHLSVLKNGGIVQDEKRGLQVFYSLRCPCVTDFFACAEKVLMTEAKERLRVINGG
jgi:ArsR family transcriptional regulator